MKKGKKEIISLVAAVMVVAAMLAALYWQRNREPEAAGEAPPPFELVHLVQRTEAELVSVTFRTHDDTHVMLPFIDENDRREWMWEGVDYILNTANTRHKVRGAFVLFASEVVHEDIYEAGISLADFGLDPPYMTVTALYDDGTTTNIYLGSPTIDLSERFVMVDGDTRLHTISRLNANRFLQGLDDLLEVNIPRWEMEAIEYILIAQRDRETIEFAWVEHHTFEGLYWMAMQQPFPGREVFEAGFEYHIFEHFSAFELGDLVNLHPSNLAVYGLDNPSLEFVYRSAFGDAHLLFGDVFFREEGGREVAYIYVQLAGRPHVFEALYEPASFLFDANPLRFIERFIALVNIQDAYGMKVTSPRGDFDVQINHVYGADNVIEPTINGNPVDDAAFRLLYRLAIGFSIDNEIETFTPHGTPLYTITYAMIDDDDIELRFFHYNESFLAVSVDGEDAWFVTNRRNFDMFIARLVELG